MLAGLDLARLTDVAYPMVCFCDIPLSRIAEHVNFYGEFGIGLTKQWAELNGLNPILYIAGENHVSASFREVNEHAHRLAGDVQQAAKTTMRYLLAHVKPATGTMVIDGKLVEKEFYQESEWRYVPKNRNIDEYLVRSKFDVTDTIEGAKRSYQQALSHQIWTERYSIYFCQSGCRHS